MARKALGRAFGRAHAAAAAARELKSPLPLVRGVRADSWINDRTGIGTGADKTAHGFYAPVRRITDVELTDLFNGSALASKIVEKRAKEMFRRGYEPKCDDVDTTLTRDLRDYALEQFDLDEEFCKGMTYGRLYGGALSILGADDGNMPDEELDESRIKSFKFINFVDRRFSYVLDYYNDPTNLAKYGRPRHYLVANAVAGFNYGPAAQTTGKTPAKELRRRGFGTTVVHESRVIRWEGVSTDYITMQTLAGWTWSVLQRVYDAMRRFEHAFDSAMHLLADASQGVFQLKNLIQSISAGQEPLLRQRLRLMDELRSVMHSIVVDKDEGFTRVATPLGGVADILDKAMLRFSGDVDMPATELFGRAPAGMNATGESDTRKWYDGIASEQGTVLTPRLKRVYKLISLSADCPIKFPKSARPRWTFVYKPLQMPTDKEQADTRLAQAQTDQIYLDEGVVSAEEVAIDRQEVYPSMDVDARREAMAAQEEFDPHAATTEESEAESKATLGQFGGETGSPNVGIPAPGTTSLDPNGSPPAKGAEKGPPATPAAGPPKAPNMKAPAPGDDPPGSSSEKKKPLSKGSPAKAPAKKGAKT